MKFWSRKKPAIPPGDEWIYEGAVAGFQLTFLAFGALVALATAAIVLAVIFA